MPTHIRTLTAPVGPWTGPGLFSGVRSTLRVFPGPPNSGVRIKRISHNEIIDAPVHVSQVTASLAWMKLPPGIPEHIAQRVVRNTVLSLGTQAAATIEHILSALAGLGIADALIELSANEVPILDGSAQDFTHALAQHSTINLAHATSLQSRAIRLRHPVTVQDNTGGTITAHPIAANEFPSATYHLDYGPTSPIAPHSATWQGNADDYVANIAPARTFSLEHEALAAQKLGFFTTFYPHDLIVVNKSGTPIDNAWRLPDEPAKHKLLDLIGDLTLLGRPLLARVEATKSGHALTHQLCLAILAADASA